MSLDQASKPWQDYAADELEYHYNPRVTTPDSDRYAEARLESNAAACADAGRSADIAYGAGDLRTLDIYRPAGGDGPFPVHVFIHGGYWRARVKEDFAYVGKALADNGLLGVVINYPLCPAVTLDEVVASNLAAFEWV
ncbi:MAG: alpha/beta hydrolase, partial [Hyphomicrobiaceae bacterium]